MSIKKIKETKTATYTKKETPMLRTGLTIGAVALAGFIGYRLFWPKLMALGSGGGGASPVQPYTPWQRKEPYIPERPPEIILERPREPIPERQPILQPTETYPAGYPYGYTGGLKPPIASQTTYQGISPVVDFGGFVEAAKAQAAATQMPTYVPTGGYYVTESGGWVKGAGW